MGKKLKTGKQRKDRYYHLAKETGYRSRAAFKLIQLNRKFEFLQRSKVLIDLCAAPGGWLQVAQKFMPVSSVVVGVDIASIKPIHNVITLQEDITTKQCRQSLQKELKTWKADVVLNDGAPNIGKNWIYDAFSQNRLTLSALQLASEFLIKGGWFITKVFRSKDYNALMWVFKKLFGKVHATKPQASRNTSAEIFVVCQNYIAPDKIDPKFFDPSFVFEDIEKTEDNEKKLKLNLLKPSTKLKKAKAEGYSDGDYTMYHKLNASDFISSVNHIQLLSDCSEIVMDTKEIRDHRLTTIEIRECSKDIKVLGRKELIAILDWRKKLRAELVKVEKPQKDESNGVGVVEDEEMMVDDVDRYMDEEARDMKRKKKKVQKEKRKLNERLNLKMVIKNDDILEEELELFQLKNIKNKKLLNQIHEINLSDVEVEEDDDEAEPTFRQTNRVYFDKDSKEVIDYDDSGPEDEDNVEEEDDNEQSEDSDEDIDDNSYQIGNGRNVDNNEEEEEEEDDDNDGLVVDLVEREEAKRNNTDMFFENDTFRDEMNDDDDDLELELIENKLNKKNKKPQTNGKNSVKKSMNKRKIEEQEEIEDSDSDSDDDNNKTIKNVMSANDEKCKKNFRLTSEELAIGTLMIKSQKTKRDITDDAWNRYSHEDDEFLPSWFRKEEEKFNRRPLPVTQEMVKEYRQQLREIDAQPIKKVAEAKARKKKRAIRKLEKARKRAENVTNTADMSNTEKAQHIKSIYKKAIKSKDKNVQYVVARKHTGKRPPKGVKGRYKMVDSRMRKDKREKPSDSKNKKKMPKKFINKKNSNNNNNYNKSSNNKHKGPKRPKGKKKR
ncbi:pre-rRNA 2'-O-ribose RNA methyltransferase FTSJ3-like [Oppia nitens]|uniref:pre-rRNA 2'-O-ribose RNA methyltransferase FTSJ3-like n=1 Tax=Oppia nitens TaxID=1686743 RepID=UPI0023D9B8C3|nr:pre-rRNA 2'-O-ribose RNA methyltransferase FTSJ3-like [Oppia nitens]